MILSEVEDESDDVGQQERSCEGKERLEAGREPK